MSIPALNQNGLLPSGIRDCTLSEMQKTFGTFQGSDKRPQLFTKLQTFVREAFNSKFVCAVIIDGSFVTATPSPNDIDLILVVSKKHDFSADVSPNDYNVLSKHRVYRRFGFDMLVARENSAEFAEWTEFFTQVRLEPDLRKGILRLVR